ncbi:unnamed protein product [Aspergillus oryzae]|uniref:Unnamed protein product n=2 Tax=Aspergillus oryzae TaxID=5062 RepID=A0AAN4YVX4_ASPOZ|nr:unnamed protein product [Aspergillus oryzae]GMF95211.1 unnamed protein product [Aspergillus oryzae]GMG13048.1 unnamed protein product [Aspergillus oryzae]GMG35928.1 unnamed protein product [Aspergillus oryzae]GMG50711.1 unnamed protein product [Aspergillus oryzae var. brunneus]
MVEDENDDDGEAGPELPPDFDAEDIPDDEEGRFFGGGMERQTAQAMQYIDQQEEGDVAVVCGASALHQSGWYTCDANCMPRFMASEADLDSEIKGLSILSEHPELYAEFSKLGCVSSLISLLSHENADIAIDAIQIISELTDEDVEAEQEQWDTLVNAMSSHAERLGDDSNLLPWLLARIQKKERPVSQNQQYSAEILAILLQSSSKTRSKFISLEGVDILLQLLSQYRKRDPAKDSDEEEFVENLFDCLICLVDEEFGKEKFLEGEGIELAQIMLKEGKFSKPRALRVLDHALGGLGGRPACERFVEAACLRTVFGMFMKKVWLPLAF